MPGKVGQSSIALSALNSFLTGCAEGSSEFNDWDGIWTLLALITARKSSNRIKSWNAQKRDVKREVSLDAMTADSGADSQPTVPWEAIARGVSPEAAAIRNEQDDIFREILAEMRAKLNERDRGIFDLILAEYSDTEIADRTQVPRTTVRYVRFRIFARLQELLEQVGFEHCAS